MKKNHFKIFYLTTISALITFLYLLNFPDIYAQGTMKMADAQFAQRLCSAWNGSSLPEVLGDQKQGGNGWIDVDTGESKVDAGYQKIVSGRYDCKDWPKLELVIKKQPDGIAKCVSAGIYNGKKVTWQFLPTTANWFNYSREFSIPAFAGLWKNGMKGPYWTAYSNRNNFKIFFGLAARIGKNSDWKSGCKGLNEKETKEAISKM